MQLQYIEIPEGVRVIGSYFFTSFGSLKTVTPIVSTPMENCIIFPESLATILNDAFNNAFLSSNSLTLLRLPPNVMRLGVRAFAAMYTTIATTEIGTLSEGSDLRYLDTYDLLTGGTISNTIYGHNGGGTDKLVFYYKTEAQRDGFMSQAGYFTGIRQKDYIPKQ